jgi:hypothetical protein
VTHGAYSVVHLQPRAEELAQSLRVALAENHEPRFEGAIAGAAMVGARLERAMAALEDAGPSEFVRLDADARGWMRLWFGALAALGLTPASAARLGVHVAQARHEDELRRHIEDKYGAEVDEELEA